MKLIRELADDLGGTLYGTVTFRSDEEVVLDGRATRECAGLLAHVSPDGTDWEVVADEMTAIAGSAAEDPHSRWWPNPQTSDHAYEVGMRRTLRKVVDAHVHSAIVALLESEGAMAEDDADPDELAEAFTAALWPDPDGEVGALKDAARAIIVAIRPTVTEEAAS